MWFQEIVTMMVKDGIEPSFKTFGSLATGCHSAGDGKALLKDMKVIYWICTTDRYFAENRLEQCTGWPVSDRLLVCVSRYMNLLHPDAISKKYLWSVPREKLSNCFRPVWMKTTRKDNAGCVNGYRMRTWTLHWFYYSFDEVTGHGAHVGCDKYSTEKNSRWLLLRTWALQGNEKTWDWTRHASNKLSWDRNPLGKKSSCRYGKHNRFIF